MGHIGLDVSRLKTLPMLLEYHAETRPETIALNFEGCKTSYAKFNELCDRMATWLQHQNLPHGQRVAYLGKNSDRYLEILFAAAEAALALVTLNRRLSVEELSFILRDAKVSHLFVDGDFERIGTALHDQLLRSKVILFERDSACYMDTSATLLFDRPEVLPRDVVMQIYTSGTTGTPKGVRRDPRQPAGVARTGSPRRPDLGSSRQRHDRHSI
jgi:long-chain acyl-CoA synthetase